LKTLRQYLPGDDVIQLVIRLGLLAFLIYWTFVLIRPFVPILVWSIVLAVALYPVFNLLSKLLGGRPRLAAVILTIINLGIVIGPATWLGLSAVEGLKDFAGNLSAGNLVVPLRRRPSAIGCLSAQGPMSSGIGPTIFARPCARWFPI
jgi:predicted PurR-regulated permease PerM